MYKILKNNTLTVFVLLAVFAFFSCDGRYRKFKSPTEVLAESNLTNAFKKQVRFVPEQPIEIVTDTIMNNGFQVKIKYHSLKDNYIKETFDVSENSGVSTFYSNFEAKVDIIKDGSYCNDFILNKAFLKDFQYPTFWNKAIMQFVWVNFEASTENILCLNTTFRIPNTETFKDFIITIDKKGVVQIKENIFLAKTV
ncbi:hypothetical protein [uncultured Algibacter sp.]|uniref:hypothetical protein n=1 Tax=uncultured Algibacter sp. TaxID=298659 RepID=UPI002613F99F|nr:hypothetical protein [uncultured Algibacter sp.]